MASSQGPLKPVFIEKSNDYNNLRHTPILKPAISILGKNIELTSQSKSWVNTEMCYHRLLLFWETKNCFIDKRINFIQ